MVREPQPCLPRLLFPWRPKPSAPDVVRPPTKTNKGEHHAHVQSHRGSARSRVYSSPDPHSAGIADDVFTVHNLVSDTATRQARQRVGPLGRPDHAVVGVGQRHELDDALQRQRRQAGADGSGAGRRRPARCSTGPPADFVISQNGKTGAARFLFATEGGTILGWSPTVNAATAIPGVDRSASGAVYKGLTTAGDRLYATDFHNNRVDVFDASFNPVTTATFKDPKLPKGYAPFGIQALAGSHLRDVREAGRRQARRRRGQRLRLCRPVHARRPARRARRVGWPDERAAERAVGSRACAVELRRVLRRHPHRQLRQRPRERVPGSRRRQVGLQGPAAPRRPDDRDDRRAVGDRVRQRLGGRAGDDALLRGRSRRRGRTASSDR